LKNPVTEPTNPKTKRTALSIPLRRMATVFF
jgi:hypothetical protein